VSLLFVVVGILRWKNLDLTFDEKAFRFRLKRIDGEAAPVPKSARRPATPE
jgi:hypothetical protein